jgi:ABC-type microcin C transport system duplicated ATPase subunit YejF
MQIIFQDPYASLNPAMKIGDIVGEPFVIHNQGTSSDRRDSRCRAPATRRARSRLHESLRARVLRRATAAHRRRA